MAHRVWGIHSVCGVRARARARGGGCASVGGTRAHACTVPVRVGWQEGRRGRAAAWANGGGGERGAGAAHHRAGPGRYQHRLHVQRTQNPAKVSAQLTSESARLIPDSDLAPGLALRRVRHAL